MSTRSRTSPAAFAARGHAVLVAFRAAGRYMSALLAEHARAHRAAAMATLPRRQLREIRELYAGSQSRTHGQEASPATTCVGRRRDSTPPP